MGAVRIRILAALVLVAAAAALSFPVGAQASGYCGKVSGLKVYASGVTCAKARYYIARGRCPRGWRRYYVYPEFGIEPVGDGCKRGGRRFSGRRD